MVVCPACNKTLEGSRYTGAVVNCLHCEAELPLEMKDALANERDEYWKAQQVQTANAPTTAGHEQVWAWVFIWASVVFVAVGLYQIYGKIDYSNKIVGGDAYDYIIYSNRGVAWIGIGLISAVTACAFLLFAVARKSAQK